MRCKATFSVLACSLAGIALLLPTLAHGNGGEGGRLSRLCAVTSIEDLSCCFKDGEDPQHCLDVGIREFARSELSISQLLRELHGARERERFIERRCHDIAHAIGRYSFEVHDEQLGRAFRACDASCHAGCYHGAMEKVLFTDEELAQGLNHLTLPELYERIPHACAFADLEDTAQSLLLQCEHGLGHALLYTLDYDLPGALDGCGLLPSASGQSSCRIGVFMENILPNDPSKRQTDPQDPLVPCRNLEEKFQNDCYRQQTKLWFSLGYTDEKIAQLCHSLDPVKQWFCFQGFGRDMSYEVRMGTPTRVVRACEVLSGDMAEACLGGVVYGLIDHTSNGEFAFQYCNALEGAWNQELCYRLSLDYLHSLYGRLEGDLHAQCTQFAREGREQCLQESARGYFADLRRAVKYLLVRFRHSMHGE